MEILNKNLLDTTTNFVVNSNTATVENVLLRDERFQYQSSGLNSDAGTNATMRINFDQTTSVSRIALVGMNWKDFTVYYNATTANTFSLTATGATTVSDFSSNSESSMYLMATPVNCTSVSIDVAATQIADQEKVIGYLAVSNVLSDFDGRVPPAQNYQPRFQQKQVVHELSDGSIRTQTFDRKFSADLRLDFVSTALKTELKSVFDTHDDFLWAPFGTTTGWDKELYACVWVNGFDFQVFTDNAANAGHSGRIQLAETRPG